MFLFFFPSFSLSFPLSSPHRLPPLVSREKKKIKIKARRSRELPNPRARFGGGGEGAGSAGSRGRRRRRGGDDDTERRGVPPRRELPPVHGGGGAGPRRRAHQGGRGECQGRRSPLPRLPQVASAAAASPDLVSFYFVFFFFRRASRYPSSRGVAAVGILSMLRENPGVRIGAGDPTRAVWRVMRSRDPILLCSGNVLVGALQ